jgi:hypothetical protein
MTLENARHAALANVVASEYVEACAAIDLDGLPLGAGWRQEIAFAVNAETGAVEELGRLESARGYPKMEPQWIFGTADVVGVEGVRDYKFSAYESHTTPASENLQLAFLGYALAKHWGADTVEVGLIHLRADGSHYEDRHTLDAFDFGAFEFRLKRIWDGVQAAHSTVASGRVPHVSQGPHCRWCPAMASCPAITTLVRAAANEPTLTADGILAMLTPQTAAAAYERLQSVKAALAPVSAALALYAGSQPIDLGGGRYYGERQTTRESVDGMVAMNALDALYGPAVARVGVEVAASKASVGRAVATVVERRRADGEKVTKAAIQREAIEAVRAAGGITSKTSSVVREYRSGAKEDADE